VVSDDDRDEDVDGDDDIFLVDTVRDPLFASNFRARTDEGFDFINGYTASATKNNYYYTPTRCMLRHGRVIRAGLERTLNRYVKFQDNDKTVNLATRLATESENVDENTDIRVNDLDTPWWWAEAYEVEAPFYSQDMQDIDDNPRGLIKLSDTKYGWILEIKTSADNKAKIKLLRANLDYITPS